MLTKEELKQSAKSHSRKLISNLSEVIEFPRALHAAVEREVEYATMDGYRITMKHKGENHEQDQIGNC